MSDALLSRVPVLSVPDVLQRLIGTQATVNLMLVSGALLSGKVVACGTVHDGRVVVLTTDDELSYVSAQAVVGVTVQRAERFVRELSDGALSGPLTAPPGAADPPTRLQVKRSVAQAATALSAALGHNVTVATHNDAWPEGEQLRVLEAVVADIVNALIAIASDDMGREALSAITHVVVDNCAAKGITRALHTLHVDVVLAHGAAGAFSATGLRDAIEAAL